MNLLYDFLDGGSIVCAFLVGLSSPSLNEFALLQSKPSVPEMM